VTYLIGREVEEDDEQISDEVLTWIERHLGIAYGWPGNIRELEQCVRNVLIRRHYEPLPRSSGSDDPLAALKRATHDATLTVEELLTRYCRLAFRKYGSYEAAAAALGIDRRTLRKRV
jgi:transcriptional regulator with PAS, ATPase and Fis domain